MARRIRSRGSARLPSQHDIHDPDAADQQTDARIEPSTMLNAAFGRLRLLKKRQAGTLINVIFLFMKFLSICSTAAAVGSTCSGELICRITWCSSTAPARGPGCHPLMTSPKYFLATSMGI